MSLFRKILTVIKRKRRKSIKKRYFVLLGCSPWIISGALGLFIGGSSAAYEFFGGGKQQTTVEVVVQVTATPSDGMKLLMTAEAEEAVIEEVVEEVVVQPTTDPAIVAATATARQDTFDENAANFAATQESKAAEATATANAPTATFTPTIIPPTLNATVVTTAVEISSTEIVTYTVAWVPGRFFKSETVQEIIRMNDDNGNILYMYNNCDDLRKSITDDENPQDYDFVILSHTIGNIVGTQCVDLISGLLDISPDNFVIFYDWGDQTDQRFLDYSSRGVPDNQIFWQKEDADLFVQLLRDLLTTK